MFGMSMTEILVIVLIILLVMGPEKIPEAARMAGKALREIRKASNLLRDAINIDVDDKPKRHISRSSEYGPPIDTDAIQQPIVTRDPRRFIRGVKMAARASHKLRGVSLKPADPTLVYREVYLHIPYEETF